MKNLLVITSFPEKDLIHGKQTVGIASYAKNTLISLCEAAKEKNERLSITVLAEKLNHEDTVEYTDHEMMVKRIWKRNSLSIFPSLLTEIFRHPDTQTVLIEFELSMFGHFFQLVGFIIFLTFLKILNKRTILVCHQVVDDINKLSSHVGLGKNSIETSIINILIRIFYFLLGKVVTQLIVFEDYLAHSLKKLTHNNHVNVIVHGVEKPKSTISQEKARKKLGLKQDEYILLYFGYIADYKGTDWIVERIMNQELRIKNKKIKLIIAGGENPNHTGKKFYEDYVSNLKKIALDSNNKIMITGYVEEEDIPLYFQACNVVILPYRVLMSSSGPLSLAFTYEKPFLISDQLLPIFNTHDAKKILKEKNIDASMFTFSLQDNSLNTKLKQLQIKPDFRRKITDYSKEIKQYRDFNRISQEYLKLI